MDTGNTKPISWRFPWYEPYRTSSIVKLDTKLKDKIMMYIDTGTWVALIFLANSLISISFPGVTSTVLYVCFTKN